MRLQARGSFQRHGQCLAHGDDLGFVRPVNVYFLCISSSQLFSLLRHFTLCNSKNENMGCVSSNLFNHDD
ncbi:hypothetical protein ACFX12_019560 [Malus domestica]